MQLHPLLRRRSRRKERGSRDSPYTLRVSIPERRLSLFHHFRLLQFLPNATTGLFGGWDMREWKKEKLFPNSSGNSLGTPFSVLCARIWGLLLKLYLFTPLPIPRLGALLSTDWERHLGKGVNSRLVQWYLKFWSTHNMPGTIYFESVHPSGFYTAFSGCRRVACAYLFYLQYFYVPMGRPWHPINFM